MAGSYQDQPNRKMSWDADQSVVIAATSDDGAGSGMTRGAFVANTVWEEMVLTDKQDITGDEDGTYGGSYNAPKYPYVYHFILFPELRDIDGYYWNMSYSEGTPTHFLSTSDDSTNPYDGTWAALGTEIVTASGTATNSDYRKNIQPGAASGVSSVLTQASYYTGVISGGTLRQRSLHIYGGIAAGETPDRLLFLDYDNGDAEFVSPLDYGNIGRGDSEIRRITIKNNSTTLQANTVQITAEHLLTGSAMFTYSTDGIADQATKSLGNIAAEATADAYVHLVIPDAQGVDLYEVRSALTVASWS